MIQGVIQRQPMRAMVVRRGLRLARYGGYGAAAAVAGYGAYRGVRRISRARKRKRARQVGKPMRKTIPKTYLAVNETRAFKNDLTLYTHNLIDVAKGGAFDQRDSNYLNVKSFSLQMNVRNTGIRPIIMKVYVASKKDYQQIIPFQSGGANDLNNEFFKEQTGLSEDISSNFETAGNGFMNLTRPINPDKWNVLYSTTLRLNGLQGGTIDRAVWGTGGSDQNIKKYIPLKRQFEFDHDTQTVEHDPVYLLYYLVRPFQTPNGTAQASCETEIRVMTGFTDPQI